VHGLKVLPSLHASPVEFNGNADGSKVGVAVTFATDRVRSTTAFDDKYDPTEMSKTQELTRVKK
jgi:hypothetical protein